MTPSEKDKGGKVKIQLCEYHLSDYITRHGHNSKAEECDSKYCELCTQTTTLNGQKYRPCLNREAHHYTVWLQVLDDGAIEPCRVCEVDRLRKQRRL